MTKLESLTALARQLETATADQQYRLIVETYVKCTEYTNASVYVKFFRMLDAGAFESATISVAETALPDWKRGFGFDFNEDTGNEEHFAWVSRRPKGRTHFVWHGATSALAMCLAVVKAKIDMAPADEQKESN